MSAKLACMIGITVVGLHQGPRTYASHKPRPDIWLQPTKSFETLKKCLPWRAVHIWGFLCQDNCLLYCIRFPLTASRLSPFAFRLIIFSAYRRGSITNRGEPAFGREASRRNLVFGWIPSTRTMKQSFASAARLRGGRAHSHDGVAAMALFGSPPPRIVFSGLSLKCDRSPKLHLSCPRQTLSGSFP